MYWDSKKIEATAVNNVSLRRAKLLAKSSKWHQLSTNYQVIWGWSTVLEHEHYEVSVSLTSNHHQCSCASNTVCKHITGLLLLYQKSSAVFKYQQSPKAIQEWFDQLNQNSPTLLTTTPSKRSKRSNSSDASAQKAKEKRWQKRLEWMDTGIQALEIWLSDMIRQGLANVPLEKTSYWTYIASKMMDAKLPSISIYLKETQALVQASSDWSALMVDRIGQLYFWVHSFQNRAQLSEAEQDHLYRSLGKTIQKKTVIQQNIALKDKWLVLGVKKGTLIDKQVYRRVWIQGIQSKQMALIEDFSYFNSPFDYQYTLGSIIDSTLYYYTQKPAQRALLEQADAVDKTALIQWSSYDCFETALADFHLDLLQNPWLRTFPFLVRDVALFLDQKQQLQCMDKQEIAF